MTRSVLVTIPYFPPDPKAGGAEMFVVAMVEGLVKEHGWDVSVVTSTSGDQPEVSAGPPARPSTGCRSSSRCRTRRCR